MTAQTETAPPADDLAGRVVGYMTPDEFFAFESIGNYENVRHELWDGKVVTVAGGKPNHSVFPPPKRTPTDNEEKLPSR